MLIIAGLGNPGAKYAGNRHSIGFMAVDALHRRYGFAPWRSRFQGEASEGMIGGVRAVLLKPATYMNESGRAVGEALRFYKGTPADVVVLHDELDLPAGKLRVKTGGGHGGHNGLRSIDAHIGKDYRRVRLGIGHPGAKELVTPYVLGDFHKVDAEWLDPMIDAVVEFAPLLTAGEDATFANKVHLATEPEKKPKKALELKAGDLPEAQRFVPPPQPETAFAAALKRLTTKKT